MKEIIGIIKKEEVSTAEALRVIEFYIYKRKGITVKINNPEYSRNKAQGMSAFMLMFEAYKVASDFLLLLNEYPEKCTVKVY